VRGPAVTAALCLVFFLSGAAALLFETLWFRLAGLVFGNSVWAASLVLASFMGGLALGNTLAARYGPRLRRPLRFYALLELVIAATGMGLVLLLPVSTRLILPLLRSWLEHPAVLNAVRLAVSFALLLVPSTAMGATLPLLVKTLLDRDASFGRTLGRLYGWNTLGAAAGALAGETALIAALGLRGTGAVAAGLDVAAGAVAWSLWRRAGEREVLAGAVASTQTRARPAIRLLAAACLCGAILLALEVVWFRFLQLFLLGTSVVFAAMLSVVLLGIGAGGLIASFWLGRDDEAHRWLPGLALLAGALSLATYATFDRPLAVVGHDQTAAAGGIAALSLWLMLGTASLSGLLFTLLGRALRAGGEDPTRATGLLTLANTTGAMLGAPLAAFALLPGLGMERSLFALAAAYGVVAALTWAPAPLTVGRRRLLWAGAAAFLLLLVSFPFGVMTRQYMAVVVQRFAVGTTRPIALREGVTETVLVMERAVLGRPVSYRLVTNGFSMSGTGMMSDRYMKLFVYLPVALHPRMERALLISYGAGTTAKALADTAAFRSIEVVDISREILGTAPLLFPPPQRTPLQDPRVRVHVEDGRFFLASTPQRFDLITAEPPPPKNAGIVSLYSREYFQLVKGRLAEGGMTTHWLPVFLLDPEDTRAIVKAFCSVFDDCSLWSGVGLNWMLAGSRGAPARVSEEEFTRQWRDPVVAPNLRNEALEGPEILGTTFIGDARFLAELTRDTRPVVDDRPHRISPRPPDAAANLPYYRALADTAATRTRFAGSEAIRRAWPEALRERTLAAFEYQRVLNEYFFGIERAGLAQRLRALHGALTRTGSRTLPVWFMDSQESEMTIAARAEQAGVTGSLVEYLRAVDAIARRDFGDGVRRLSPVLARNPGVGRIAGLNALALHLAGDTAAATAAADRACPPAGSALDAESCAWLKGTLAGTP